MNILSEILQLSWNNIAMNFPAESCTKQDENDSEVFNSDDEYLCALAHDAFPDRILFLKLRPYICIGEDKDRIFYGWTDGNNQYDHVEKPIHDDLEQVVLWKKL